MEITRVYRAQLFGRNSREKGDNSTQMYVHLPAEWIREQGIEKGTNLTVAVKDDLIVITKSTKQNKPPY